VQPPADGERQILIDRVTDQVVAEPEPVAVVL